MAARLPPAPDFISRALPESVQAPQGGMMGAQVMNGIGDRVMALAQDYDRQANRQTEMAALDAGMAAGEASPGVQMQGGGAVYQSAFNRGAVEAARNRIEIDARQEYDRLARQHSADPAAFSAAATAYRDRIVADLPVNVRSRVVPGLDSIARPYLNGIVTQQDRAVADERLATLEALLPQRNAEIERLALRGNDPEAVARIAEVQAQTQRDLIAQGPRHAFTFNGVQYPPDPSRGGALTLTQIQEGINRARDTELLGLARGEWQRSPRSEAWINEFEQRGLAGEIPGLRPDQVRQLAGTFRRERAHEREVLNEGQRQARRDLQPLLDANQAAYRETGAPVEVIDDARLQAAGLDVGRYRAQERAWQQGWQARQDLAGMTDPAGAQIIADRFAPGTPLFMADPQLALQLRELARERGARINAANLDQVVADRMAQHRAGIAAANRAIAAVPADWLPHIEAGARQHGLPLFMVRALIGTESGGRADAVSPRGAIGPAQVMPATAASPGLGMQPLPPDAMRDPARAIPWGIEYLARLRDHFGGNLQHALMAYNWGIGRVQDWIRGGSPAGQVPRETQIYVQTMMAAASMDGVMGPGGDPAARGGAGSRTTMTPLITPEEARAAGQTPEWLDRANRTAEEHTRTAALRWQVMNAPAAERAAIEAELVVRGERAAEDERLAQVHAEALQERRRAIHEDPAAFVASISPTIRELQARVTQGDLSALPQLMETSLAEQRRQQDVPAAAQRALAKPVADSIASSIAMAPDAQTAIQRLAALRQAVGDARLPDALVSLRLEGAIPADRRQATLMAASISASSPQVAEQIMRGVYALRDNPMPGLTAERMAPQVDAVLGTAFQDLPAARDGVVAAARALYAAEALAEGRMGQPFDASRFRSALERVAPTTSYNGHRVLLPDGMQPQQFERLMEGLPQAALDGARAADGRPFTPAMATHGATQLIAIGPGRYRINYGAFQVLGPDNRVFVLDLTNREPVAPVRGNNAAQRGGTVQRARAAAAATGYDPATEDPPPPEPQAPPAPPRDPNAPVGATMGLGGTRITNQPVGSSFLPGLRRRATPDGGAQ